MNETFKDRENTSDVMKTIKITENTQKSPKCLKTAQKSAIELTASKKIESLRNASKQSKKFEISTILMLCWFEDRMDTNLCIKAKNDEKT